MTLRALLFPPSGFVPAQGTPCWLLLSPAGCQPCRSKWGAEAAPLQPCPHLVPVPRQQPPAPTGHFLSLAAVGASEVRPTEGGLLSSLSEVYVTFPWPRALLALSPVRSRFCVQDGGRGRGQLGAWSPGPRRSPQAPGPSTLRVTTRGQARPHGARLRPRWLLVCSLREAGDAAETEWRLSPGWSPDS